MKFISDLFSALTFVLSLPFRAVYILYISFKMFNHRKRNEEILSPVKTYVG